MCKLRNEVVVWFEVMVEHVRLGLIRMKMFGDWIFWKGGKQFSF